MTWSGALVLTLVSFGLNWVWEQAQCRPFFVHAEPTHGQLAMIRAASGDVAMTWITYGLVAVVSRRWSWIAGTWARRQWIAIVVSALAMSVGLESYALATGRWSYTPFNPLVPGLGVSVVPLLQLLLLLPAAFWVTAAVLRRSPAGAEAPGEGAGPRGAGHGLDPSFTREEERKA